MTFGGGEGGVRTLEHTYVYTYIYIYIYTYVYTVHVKGQSMMKESKAKYSLAKTCYIVLIQLEKSVEAIICFQVVNQSHRSRSTLKKHNLAAVAGLHPQQQMLLGILSRLEIGNTKWDGYWVEPV